jgi:hypothetical protein
MVDILIYPGALKTIEKNIKKDNAATVFILFSENNT